MTVRVYRYRDPSSGLLDGDVLPVGLAASATSGCTCRKG